MARQRARADGLPFGNVALDEDFQQVLGARVEHVEPGGTRTVRSHHFANLTLSPDGTARRPSG